MTDRSRPRRPAPGPGVLGTASVALAAFLVLLVVLATQLRDNPRAAGLFSQKPRIVVVRRLYETVVHERLIGATAASGASATTVSSSRVSASSSALPARPLTTRTS